MVSIVVGGCVGVLDGVLVGVCVCVGVCVSWHVGMNAVLDGCGGEYCSGWVCRRVGRGSGGGVFTSGDTYDVGVPTCGHL